MSPLATPLRGLVALVRSKRRTLTYLPLLAGLLPALGAGVFAHLSDVPPEDLAKGLGVAALIMGLAAPVAATVGLVASQQPRASRRDELLVLPVGRLAIPSAVFVVSAATFALWLLAALVGLGLTLGVEPLERAAATDTARAMALGPGALLLATSCLAIFHEASILLVIWSLVGPFVVCLALEDMGYDGSDAGLFRVACGAALGLLCLALPFVLYARAPHHWATLRRGTDATADGVAAVTTCVALAALGLLGAGWVFGTVVAVGATLTVRGLRGAPRPERPRTSHLRVTHGLLLLLALPLAAFGVWTDAARVASVAPGGDATLAQVVPSPRGDLVAVVLEGPAAGGGALRRVAVVDASGQAAPRVLPARFTPRVTWVLDGRTQAGREECGLAWSADGRYLAVEDDAVGRIRGTRASVALAASRWDGLLLSFWERLHTTWLHDATTGETRALAPVEALPGWSGPDQLVLATRGWGGEQVLRDGAGRTLALPGSEVVTVTGYDERGGVLLERRARDAATGQAWRWDGARVEPCPPFEGWLATAAPRERAGPFEPRADFTLRRGDATVPVGPAHAVYGWSQRADETVLASDASGLVRVALPSGERHVVLAAGARGVSVSASWASVAGTFVLVSRDGGDGPCEWFRLDLTTDAVTPLALARDQTPVALLAGGDALVLGADRRALLRRAADGTTRVLLEAGR